MESLKTQMLVNVRGGRASIPGPEHAVYGEAGRGQYSGFYNNNEYYMNATGNLGKPMWTRGGPPPPGYVDGCGREAVPLPPI